VGLFTHRGRSKVRPGRAAPDAILRSDHAWLVAGVEDGDLSNEATARRVRLLLQLIADQSFEAAERVLERVLAAPIADDADRWNALYAEFCLLRGIPKLEEERVARRQAVGEEIVRRYGDSSDMEVRGEALMIDATLKVSDGPSANRWLAAARRRPDFEELMKSDKVVQGIGWLERIVEEDGADEPSEWPDDDMERILALLRWWSEPGAALPARLGTTNLPPPGAVDVHITDAVDSQDALALAAHLAAAGRCGDALGCIRAVSAAAAAEGHNLTVALTSVIEGQLLVLLDRVPEAAERLCMGASQLYELSRLDLAGQAYLEVARLGATHPELDDILTPWVEAEGSDLPGARLLAVTYAARAIFELLGEPLGTWTADLLRAQTLFGLGRIVPARAAILALGEPPPGAEAESARASAALARARIVLTTDDLASGRRAVAAAGQTAAAHRPWFAWQLELMRAELEFADGHLDEAWAASAAALDMLGALRPAVGDERDRASWAASRRDAWQLALRIAARRGRPADALAVIEHAKSAHLARIVFAQATATAEPETVDLLREALSGLPASSVRHGDVSQHALGAVHETSADLLRLLRLRDAQLAAAVTPPQLDRDTLLRLRAAIGDFVLLDYADLGEASLWRVVARPGGAIHVREIKLDAHQKATLATLDAAADGDAVEQWIWEGGDTNGLDDLAEALLGDVGAIIADWPADLVISPSGRLGNVPWAMLRLGDGMVIDRTAVTLVPSLVLGVTLADRRPQGGPPVMLCCDPRGDLAGVAQQRDRLVQQWPGLTVHQGADAGLRPLVARSRNQELSGASRLIWAGHGMAHPDEPLASGLLLGDGSILTAGSLAALSLPACVELWTCGSAAERRLSFDEQLGLAAACFRAGASSVLASMWSLDDTAVAQLSERYHDAIIRGEAPARALRQAQLASREELEPSVWGAIALWGVAGTTARPARTEPAAGPATPSSHERPTAHRAAADAVAGLRWAPPRPMLGPVGGDVTFLQRKAAHVAARRGWPYVGTGHLLWLLVHDEHTGPLLVELGLFPTRIESLLLHLPVFGVLGEAREWASRNSPESATLRATLSTVRLPAADAAAVAIALLGVPGSDACEIVRQCGLDPSEVVRWLEGEVLPDALRWSAYAPRAAALVEVDASELYEELCVHAPPDPWTAEPWPRRVRALFAARAKDVTDSKTRGRVVELRAKTLASAQEARAARRGADTGHRLLELALTHAKAQHRLEDGSPSLGDPQAALAVAAGRAGLVVAQAQGLASLQSSCHALLGDLLRSASDPHAAVAHARVAGELARFVGDDRALAYAEIVLANAIVAGDPLTNFEIYAEHRARAAEILRRIGDLEEADAVLADIEDIRSRR
jgi:hypothetical protein